MNAIEKESLCFASNAAKENHKRESYFDLAMFEVGKLLDNYKKINDSLSMMSDYLAKYGLPKPEVYLKILTCRESQLKAYEDFMYVVRGLCDIIDEKENHYE